MIKKVHLLLAFLLISIIGNLYLVFMQTRSAISTDQDVKSTGVNIESKDRLTLFNVRDLDARLKQEMRKTGYYVNTLAELKRLNYKEDDYIIFDTYYIASDTKFVNGFYGYSLNIDAFKGKPITGELNNVGNSLGFIAKINELGQITDLIMQDTNNPEWNKRVDELPDTLVSQSQKKILKLE